jgi:Tol biopolymer transport system component
VGESRGVRVGVGRARGRRARIASAVFTAGLAVVAATPSVQATFPGRNGRIAFTTIEYSAESNDDYREIVSISSDGSAPRRLAREAEDPAYRPDGHMIAFARAGGIFLMRSDGSAKRRLLSGPYAQPDWSPDGKRLLVTRMRRPRSIFIWSSGKLSALTRGTQPAWSPTGELIAFTRVHGLAPNGEFLESVHVMHADGSRVRRLESGFDPEWSPNGRRILFTRFDGSIRSIRPNRTGLRAVTPIQAFSPIYSPNGRLISFSKRVPANGFSHGFVVTMRADGRRRKRIYNVTRDLPPCCPHEAWDLDWQPRPRPRP